MLMLARAFITEKNIQTGRRREGHCRYLALSNDLIYDRFIKHQNYVYKPLKTINCCKNCASNSTHTLTAALDSSKMQRATKHHLSLSTQRAEKKNYISKKNRLSFRRRKQQHNNKIDISWMKLRMSSAYKLQC